MKTLSYLILGFGAFAMVGCSNDAMDTLNNESLTTEQVKSQMQLNTISEGLDELLSELILDDKSAQSSKTETDCATMELGEESISVTYKQCSIHGKTINGTIVLSGTKGFAESSKGSYEVRFNAFTFNNYELNGTKTFSYDFSDSNSPTFSVTTNVTFKDAKGEILSWKGNKVLTWHLDQINTEGADFSCMGDWAISADGITYEFSTVEALSGALDCPNITSGTLQLEVDGLMASLDFGNGVCDQKGTVSYPNGETEEISW